MMRRIILCRNFQSLLAFTCLFLCSLPAIAQVDTGKDDTPIKVDTLLVNIPLIVSDRDGRHIAGLTKQDFSVLLDGENQTIEYFFDADAPVSVAIIVDLSFSVRPYLPQIRKAAKTFAEQLKSNDQATVLTFDQFQDIQVTCPLTSDKKRISKKIDMLYYNLPPGLPFVHKRSYYPDMYEAIDQVLKKEFAAVNGRKAIIVLTDGFIVGRTMSESDFNSTIVESDAIIYPVMFVTRHHLAPKAKSITLDELAKHPAAVPLDKLAYTTGGRLLIAANDMDFDAAFQSVADELRKQYVLGFYPTSSDLSRTNSISISVARPDGRVRSKRNIHIQPLNAPQTP